MLMNINVDLVALLIIAVVNFATGIMTWYTHKRITQVEVATNSMKDALVESTSKASFAEGREEGRTENHRKRKIVKRKK